MNTRVRAPRLIARIVAVATIALFSSAAFSAVILIDEQRYVHSSGLVESPTQLRSWGVEERSTGTFGEFAFAVDEQRSAGSNTAGASANIISDISTTQLQGAGIASAFSEINESSDPSAAEGFGKAYFEVSFELTEATFFDLTGTLSFMQDDPALGSAYLSIENSDSSFSLTLGQQHICQDFEQVLDLSGVFESGIYTLRAEASVEAAGMLSAGTAMFDFNINMSAVAIPVPAAFWMFGSGLLMLVRARRRQA